MNLKNIESSLVEELTKSINKEILDRLMNMSNDERRNKIRSILKKLNEY